ncbi:hypothetical protein BDW72DRAFT_194370 [Aspergillus terricola var. indicus]
MAALMPIGDIPTISLLYKLKRPVPNAHPLKSPSRLLNDTVAMVRHDITKLQGVDCIVNAAKRSLLGGGGVDYAIHKAAGPDLLKECRTLNGCDTGDAKITNAYNLPNKRIIHTVGPIYSDAMQRGKDEPERLLRSCYRRCLEVAVENEMKSIAFNAISTGIYGYPSRDAAKAALDETRKFLEADKNTGLLERVIFCNFELKDVEAYEQLMPLFFPPAEHAQGADSEADATTNVEKADTMSKDAEANNEAAHNVTPSSPSVLAISLPDPPTKEPTFEGQPESKKQKVSAQPSETDPDDRPLYVSELSDLKSEDEWDSIEAAEARNGRFTYTEALDSEPVEIDRPSPTTDVQSIQSSGIIDDLVHSQSTDGFLGKD